MWRLRGNLIFAPDESGATVIKDPARNSFYRVGPDEVALLRLCDGSRSPEEIRREFERQADAVLPEEVLRGFLDAARQRGWFDEASETGHGSGMAMQARGPWLGRLLYLKLKAFDPDPFLSRLHPHVRWCLTPAAGAAAVLLVTIAGWIFWSGRAHAAESTAALARPTLLAVTWAAIGVMLILHETGHGIACKHWGGKVPEMGFLLVCFIPCAYTDVSDAWLFPRRGPRLVVTLAGPLVQAVLWAGSVLVWRVTAVDTAVHQVAYAVAAANVLGLALNLNPLLKLDGYYLLSDFVGIPNLRQRAISFLFGKFSARTWRERFIYAGYGVLALGWTWAILGSLALLIGRSLTHRYGAVGTAAFGGLLMAAVVPSQPAQAVPAAAAPPRRRPRKRWIFLGAIGVAVVVGLLFEGDLRVSGPVDVHSAAEVVVRAPWGGMLSELRVTEGQRVAEGDVLVVLDARELEIRSRRARAELEEARSELDRMVAGPRPEEIEVAERRLEASVARTAFALSQVERLRTLMEQNAVSSMDLERAEAQYTVSQKEEDEARSQVALVRAGYRHEEIAAAERRVEALDLARQEAEEAVRKAEIRAPVGGIVLGDVSRLAPGRVVSGGEELFLIGSGALEAQIQVSERDIGEVVPGAEVRVKLAAYPERTIAATVDSIGSTAGAGSEPGRMVIVRARIESGETPLRPGMTGYARVTCGRHRLLWIWTRKFIHSIRLEFW